MSFDFESVVIIILIGQSHPSGQSASVNHKHNEQIQFHPRQRTAKHHKPFEQISFFHV